MDGLIGLLKSKKGTVVGAVLVAIGGMATGGLIPAVLAAKLIAGVAGIHAIGQGIADFGKEKPGA